MEVATRSLRSHYRIPVPCWSPVGVTNTRSDQVTSPRLARWCSRVVATKSRMRYDCRLGPLRRAMSLRALPPPLELKGAGHSCSDRVHTLSMRHAVISLAAVLG